MVVIKTQLAFVLQMRGRTNEANNIYNSVLKQRDADQAVLAVASNNIGKVAVSPSNTCVKKDGVNE